MMPNRRGFLRILSSLPLVGGLVSSESGFAAGKNTRDYFAELGVRPFINAAGTYTAMTASLMPEEVVQAIQWSSRQFVMLDELHDAVGRRLAQKLECEAAMVTAGAASALTLGTAGVLTGKDLAKIHRLPDLTGMKSEVLIQKKHRFGYEHAIRNCGVKLVEVETPGDVERALNEKTAMMMFLNFANPDGQIKDADWVDLGKKFNIPTFNDCAADVPPVENLKKYTRMGFDLVTFSGGKGLCGPQSSGLLLGRKELIEAARLNAPPNGDAIGRGMKVNKEEMLGLLVAVERYLSLDHEKERKEFDRRAELIRKRVTSATSVKAEIFLPPIANHVPHLKITWDTNKLKLAYADAAKLLRDGKPSIGVLNVGEGLQVGVWMMQPGEAEVVARRIHEVLSRG
jgi:D-glucosaminate-6-phosphate ammonia-lyase